MFVNRKNPSLEEMWRVIEIFGIQCKIFEKFHLIEEDILMLYYLIKTSKCTQKD